MKASKQYIKKSKEPTLKRIDNIIERIKAFTPDKNMTISVDFDRWWHPESGGFSTTSYNLYISSDQTPGYFPATAKTWPQFIYKINEWLREVS